MLKSVNYVILAGSADGWEAAITSATVGAAFIFSFVGGFVTDRLVVHIYVLYEDLIHKYVQRFHLYILTINIPQQQERFV